MFLHILSKWVLTVQCVTHQHILDEYSPLSPPPPHPPSHTHTVFPTYSTKTFSNGDQSCLTPTRTSNEVIFSLFSLIQIKSLRNYLAKVCVFPCCQLFRPIRECVPGIVTCPGPSCSRRYRYSWCAGL